MDGYRLLPEAFDAEEVQVLRTVVESVHADVVDHVGETSTEVWPDGHRLQQVRGTTVHWEPDADPPAVRSLSPVAHLHPVLADLWHDPRLTEPMRDLLDADEVGPFTSKVNFKRASVGSEFQWHQDFPFWYCCAGHDAQDVFTAVVFLDDTTPENGALVVVPGSHRNGPMPRDRREPTGLYVDTSLVDTRQAVPVPAQAGSVALFPGTLVHRSGPNRTAGDRRSLLYCFQPAGRKPLSDLPYRHERLADLP